MSGQASRGLIDRLQFCVLGSCADDYELFYFPFAEANYGGQIFPGRSDPGEEPGRFASDLVTWPVSFSGPVVAAAIEATIQAGFLSWRRCVTQFDREGAFLTTPIPVEELRAYEDYDCVTYEDHIERHGYGPHEFYITRRGVEELRRPEYDAYLPECEE